MNEARVPVASRQQIERIPTTGTNIVEANATSLMQVISRAASDPSVDVDKLERLMSMYERITAGEAKTAYVAAFSKMQPDLPVIDRNGKITIKEKNGDKIIQSTPYALWEDINEAIGPILAAHGFGLSFRTGMAADGRVTVTAILSHERGHCEETTMTLQHDSTGSKNAVQAIGSSTSYGKRYTAMAMLNLTSRAQLERDDDGKAAGGPATVDGEKVKTLLDLIEQTGTDIEQFCRAFTIEAVPEMREADFERAKSMLARKAARK